MQLFCNCNDDFDYFNTDQRFLFIDSTNACLCEYCQSCMWYYPRNLNYGITAKYLMKNFTRIAALTIMLEHWNYIVEYMMENWDRIAKRHENCIDIKRKILVSMNIVLSDFCACCEYDERNCNYSSLSNNYGYCYQVSNGKCIVNWNSSNNGCQENNLAAGDKLSEFEILLQEPTIFNVLAIACLAEDELNRLERIELK